MIININTSTNINIINISEITNFYNKINPIKLLTFF